MPFAGELIALATVMCWTVSVQFFEAASKRVGAVPVGMIRLTAAMALFSGYMMITHGCPVPVGYPVRAWILLSLSGIVGFFLGDICLFKALLEIGPRITLVIFSLAAPVSAVIGWMFLDEAYDLVQWAGMLVTLTGVCMVILEKNKPAGREKVRRAVTPKGLLLGTGAMLGQALGYVLSKSGMTMETGFLDAFGATQIRALAAFVCYAALFSLTRKWLLVARAARHRQALVFTLTGSFIGPFLGVSLSLLTLHYLSTGVASTFLSLTPVTIIPFAVFVHKEQVSLRAVMGAVVAVAGIYLLMSP